MAKARADDNVRRLPSIRRRRFTCLFCRQPIRPLRPRMPVKRAGQFVGFIHSGCGLRGSKRTEWAKQRRQLLTGHTHR